MKKVNQLVVCKDDYNTKEEFENAIKDAVMVLLNNNYIMTVKYDEKEMGIVAIEYDYADLCSTRRGSQAKNQKSIVYELSEDWARYFR